MSIDQENPNKCAHVLAIQKRQYHSYDYRNIFIVKWGGIWNNGLVINLPQLKILRFFHEY